MTALRGIPSLATFIGSGAQGATVTVVVLLAGAVVAGLVLAVRRRRTATPGSRDVSPASDAVTPTAPAQAPLTRLEVRARSLEQIVAATARITGTRQMTELVGHVVDAVSRIMGFERVVLYIWSDATGAFEVRAARGVPAGEMSAVCSRPVTRDILDAEADPRRRLGNCILLGDAPEPGADAPPSRPWRPGTRLVAPLAGPGGETFGYLEVSAPPAGATPGSEEIQLLEYLTQQAATAIEAAEVCERLARNNAELSAASERLASLADMKANFVASVSHELRTPLTSISAYTELLQQNLASMPRESLDEFLKVIHSESRKLTVVINDILELSRMEKGEPLADRAETDVAALVRRMEEGWRSLASERGLELHVRAPAAPLRMPADPLLMQQLLTHLVSNACKFTPPGGRVVVTLTESGTAVRLTVEDTGIGIPADKLGTIFDKFYQVDGSATREHNGQGVGLAICHEIVNHHDGRIWAENIEPGGTRFTVLLPRRPAVVQLVPAADRAGLPFVPGEFLQRLIHWLAASLGVQTVTLMEPGPDGEHLVIRAAIGLSDTVVQATRVSRGGGIAGRVWTAGTSLLVADITRDPRFGRQENEPRYSTPSLLCVPLPGPDGARGVISVNNRVDGRSLDDDDRLFLEALAPCVADLLDRHQAWLHTTRGFGALRDGLRATTAVGHLRHESLLEVCQEICLAAARRVGLAPAELHNLAFALQFYDVGMGSVPPQLRDKPEPLAPHEQRLVQRHVAASLEILDPLHPDPQARQIILHHHENFDGSGYPDGLSGEAIPMGARLLRLTDALAALLSPRPWRPRYELEDAVRELEAGAGRHFCPHLCRIVVEEAHVRTARITDLQRQGAEGLDLAQPVLDRRGMVPVS